MSDTDSGIVCAIFHDVSDGYEFGKLLASQVIIRFEQEYGKNPSSANPQLYEGFTARIPDILRGMVQPILLRLRKQRGIKHASLVSGGNVLPSTNTDLSISANLKILMSHCTDLMNSALDHPKWLRIEGDAHNIQVVQAEHSTHLVVLCQKNIDTKKMDQAIQQSTDLIKKGSFVVPSTFSLLCVGSTLPSLLSLSVLTSCVLSLLC